LALSLEFLKKSFLRNTPQVKIQDHIECSQSRASVSAVFEWRQHLKNSLTERILSSLSINYTNTSFFQQLKGVVGYKEQTCYDQELKERVERTLDKKHAV